IAQGRLEEAAAGYRKALTIKPDYVEAHSNLGTVLIAQGRLEEAAAGYRKALAIKPDFAEAHNNLGNVLIEQGRLEEAAAGYRKALAIKPDFVEAHSNLLFCLNYFPSISRKDIYNESLKWDHQHAKKIPRKEPVYANKKEKERKLRIGYVSPDFRNHSVHYFFEPLLKTHNKENVEVYCYSNVMAPDNVTERLTKESDNWLSIIGKNDEDVAEQISRDGIDILVDLAGHTAKNRLLVFAYKPAPIQVTWLGYSNTTGMSAIDYRFTDEVADPIGEADNLHSEELIRLESGFLCYSGDESSPEISALPCLERGHITFGSFNNLTKTTPEVVKLWSDILRAAPNSHLLLKSKQLMDEGMRERYQGMFEKEGISGDRVELFSRFPKKEDHLRFYSKIDIGLDPFPYNGTATTFEALWMGIPVITLEGDRHAARVGTSIMTHLNLPQFIADTKENYIKKAVELAGDRKRLAVYRKDLRSILQSSKSCDEHHFAKKIETAFREMWRTWCQSDPVFPVTVSEEDESPLESTISPKLSSPANNAINGLKQSGLRS
ncbi:MAG: tetratricopeptide repeat protein, partial [Deltaproteobacteria bacterium]|nr:tetratricopeptide repeat protein [Deltaproteobacteria bacterium]